MASLTKIGKGLFPLAGAVFLEPLLNLFAPSIKPLIKQAVESDAARNLLTDLVSNSAEAGSGVCTQFLANQAQKLLQASDRFDGLDRIFVDAFAQALRCMRDDLRTSNRNSILNSYDKYFSDWELKLETLRLDDKQLRDWLETGQFASVFYESTEIDLATAGWWPSVKAELERWTEYGTIPLELNKYLEVNLLSMANRALSITLNSERYRNSWSEFQKSVGVLTLSTLRRLNTYISDLKRIAEVSGGRFIQEGQRVDLSLRKRVDSLVTTLATQEIYITRNALLVDENVQISGLQDLIERDGYFLLAAPAGSGKSSLMARWIRNVAEQPAWKICYHFYNTQEGTADHTKGLTILSDQLLKAHNIEANVNSFNSATVDVIVPHILELPSLQKIFIIVDGLDEAGDPATATEFLSLFKRLFPTNLGKNSTVILTIRSDLGTDSLDYYRRELALPLRPLTVPEVNSTSLAAYLSVSSDKALQRKALDSSFLEELISKTDGLAIYVHYLLDELKRTDEQHWSKTIAGLPLGFEEYVKKSLPAALQDEPGWEEALSFLSLTRVALAIEDLITLTQLTGIGLKRSDFDRIKWKIKRWLKNEINAWSFSHAKIGQVFYECYVSVEKQKYLDHLLAYCRSWKQHDTRFVLQNYAELLRRAGKQKELYALAINRDFFDTQLTKLAENPNAALRTLRLAMMTAADQDEAGLLARFCLAHATAIEKLSCESWHEAYIRRGYQGAVELADNFGAVPRRVAWYLLITWKMIVENKNQEAEVILNRLAASQFQALPADLHMLAESSLPVFLRTVNVDLVLNIYSRALPQQKLGLKLLSISQHLARIGKLQEAERIANSIEDPPSRVQACGRIAGAFERIGRLDKSSEIFDGLYSLIDSIKVDQGRCQALGLLAAAFANAGRSEQAHQAFDQATLGIRSIERSEARTQTIRFLARTMSHVRLFEEAEEVGERLSEASLISGSFKGSPALTRSSTSARLSKHSNSHEITQLLMETERASRALAEPRVRAETLGNLAKYLTIVGNFDKAVELFNEAKLIARSIEDPGVRHVTLVDLISALAHPKLLFRAKRFAQKVREPGGGNSTVLVRLATALLDAGYFQETRQIASLIKERWSRVQVLRNLVLTLADLGRMEEATEGFEDAKTTAYAINANEHRALALANLASLCHSVGFLSDVEKLCCDAHDSVLKIQNPLIRARAFRNLGDAISSSLGFVQAQRFWDAGKEVSGEFGDSRIDSQTLSDMGKPWVETGLFENPDQVAKYFDLDRKTSGAEHESNRVQALGAFATALSKTGEWTSANLVFDEAERVVNMVTNNQAHRHLLIHLTTALAQARNSPRAFRVATSITNSLAQAQAMRNLSTELAIAGDFDFAWRIAQLIKTNHLRAQALANIGLALARDKHFDEANRLWSGARELLNDLKVGWFRSEVIKQMPGCFTAAELLRESERAKRIKHGPSRARSLHNIVTALAIGHYFDQAISLCATIENLRARSHGFARIATTLFRVGRLSDSERLFADAERVARSVDDLENRSKALGQLASLLVRVELFEDAKKILGELRGNVLVKALNGFANANHADPLKKYIVSLSYDTAAAFQACAQLVLLYEEQTAAIYKEASPYLSLDRP